MCLKKLDLPIKERAARPLLKHTVDIEYIRPPTIHLKQTSVVTVQIDCGLYLSMDTSKAVDPSNVGRDAGKHIGGSVSAGDSPGDGTNDGSTSSQWATRVSHAHSEADGRGGADRVVVHTGTVDDAVGGTAGVKGHGLHGQELESGGSTSGVLCCGK